MKQIAYLKFQKKKSLGHFWTREKFTVAGEEREWKVVNFKLGVRHKPHCAWPYELF
jgi:hypothetical protein